MAYKVLLIEDEFPTRELLQGYILSRKDLNLSGVTNNGIDALEKLKTYHFDILLLDISLPDLSGLEIIKSTHSLRNTFVIFSTAYHQHAVEAFDAGAVDYLLKPYAIERFNQAIDKAIVFLKNSKNKTLQIKITNPKVQNQIIPLHEIIYLTAKGKHTIFHTTNGDYETFGLLKNFLEELTNDFIRVHKQYAVNKIFISGFSYSAGGAYHLTLKDDDDTTLPVGRIYAKNLKSMQD